MSKVTVIIPSMGSERYLPEAIASVRAQTYGDWTIIVAAGGDADAAIARACGLRVVDGCNRGPGDARNRAIEAATSPYILPLDADDVIVPPCLERFVAAARDGHFIVSSSTWAFGDRSDSWQLPPFATVLDLNPLSTASLFPRALWKAAGGFDVALLGYEDWDFWIRCSRFKPTVTVMHEPMLRYRVHADSAMSRIKHENLDGLYKAMLRLRHPEFAGRAGQDREIVMGMPRQVKARLLERLRAFPENEALLAFRAMVRR